MNWRNTHDRWGVVSQVLHWSIAVLVIGLALIGLIMDELPTSPTKLKIFALHKSFGITVLALMLLRIVWRLFERRPAYPAQMPGWQRSLAAATHFLLYVLLLLLPISGWLYNSAANFPLRWFGLLSLPALTGPNPELKAQALAIHHWGFYVLALLFAVHVAAALKHHLIDQDNTLRAMLPRSSSKDSPE